MGRAGRACKTDPVAGSRGSMVDRLCTQLPREAPRHGARKSRGSICSMWFWSTVAFAASPGQVSLRLRLAAMAGQQLRPFFPTFMQVAARHCCCWWPGGTTAYLQRLKTRFQRAAGAGVGISLPWHGCSLWVRRWWWSPACLWVGCAW